MSITRTRPLGLSRHLNQSAMAAADWEVRQSGIARPSSNASARAKSTVFRGKPLAWGLPANVKQKVVWLCGKCARRKKVNSIEQRCQVLVVVDNAPTANRVHKLCLVSFRSKLRSQQVYFCNATSSRGIEHPWFRDRKPSVSRISAISALAR